jgi:hypothetical protein
MVLIVVVVVAILAIGLIASLPYFLQYKSSHTTITSSPGTVTLLTTNTGPAYDCSLPAVNSQLSCATLPPNYKIPPRLPGAPPAICPTGMTAAACALFQQTYGNGVCDPNETSLDAPLDCSCPGTLTPDPYTGRCTDPASVCQVAAAIEAEQAMNSTNQP